MYSGPSSLKLEQRAGSSGWKEESPRSRKAPSKGASPIPSASIGSLESAKFPGTKRKASPNSAFSASARPRASRWRSMARRTPPGKMRLRISRECRPPPNVPSKKTAPGVGWRIDIASSKSTGTCFGPPGPDESAAGVAVSYHLVGELGEVVGGRLERLPGTFTPDLDDVVDAHHHGVALDPGGLTEPGGDQRSALAVEFDLVGFGEKTPDQVALAGLGRGADTVLLGHPIPLRRRIDPQAGFGSDRDPRP